MVATVAIVLLLIIQMKRRYKNKKANEGEDIRDDEEDEGVTGSSDEHSTSDGQDQDSSISSEHDTEKGSSQDEEEQEDWIEYIKRSTKKAGEKMQTIKVTNWTDAQRKIKWRLASRIAAHREETWTGKAAEWNPVLITSLKAHKNSKNTIKEIGR